MLSTFSSMIFFFSKYIHIPMYTYVSAGNAKSHDLCKGNKLIFNSEQLYIFCNRYRISDNAVLTTCALTGG